MFKLNNNNKLDSVWQFAIIRYLVWIIPGLFCNCFILCKKNIKLQTTIALLPLLIIFLKYNTTFSMEQLVDVCVVDSYSFNQRYRFSVIYSFLSIKNNTRALVTVKSIENNPLPSVVELFNSITWLERENWDMFGIFFTGGLDIRRLLTDYSFSGFPLRKNFPVVGLQESFFDDSAAYIVQEPVSFSQDPRIFYFNLEKFSRL